MSELNPQKSLEAILKPNPIKLGQMALLDFFQCRCAIGDFSSMIDNGFACWILEHNSVDIASKNKSRQELLLEALDWMDGLTQDEFFDKVEKMCDGIKAYYDALPKAEESQKKTINEAMA